MQVNPCNETNLYPSSEPEPTVHIHVQQSPVQSQQSKKIAVLRPEHIPFLKYLTLNILIPFFDVTPRDIYALGHVSKVFRQTLLIDQEKDGCMDKPSSFLNICRVRHSLSNTQKNPMSDYEIIELIQLELSLDVHIRPFPYIHHLAWNPNLNKTFKKELRRKGCELELFQLVKLKEPELVQIINYTALRSLILLSDNTDLINDVLIQIAHLTQLRDLSLNLILHPNACLEPLTQLTNLKSLILTEYTENADHWKTVAKISSLDTLNLTLYCIPKITDAGLNALQGLTALKNLYLERCNISATHLKPLAGNLKKLTFINKSDLRDNFLQDEDAHALGSFTSLQHLTLQYCTVTNVALVELNRLSTLLTLELVDAKVTITDLAQLHGLTALRHLYINAPTVNEVCELWQLRALQTVTVGIGIGCSFSCNKIFNFTRP